MFAVAVSMAGRLHSGIGRLLIGVFFLLRNNDYIGRRLLLSQVVFANAETVATKIKQIQHLHLINIDLLPLIAIVLMADLLPFSGYERLMKAVQHMTPELVC